MPIPRIVIAGTQSGVGKTTMTVGLMAALKRRNYQIQPYKVGPDYIDPGFHTLVTGNQSRNLDSFFLGEEGLTRLFLKTSEQADLSIIEGVMGLFDGKGKRGESSTARIAKILCSPIILIIDGRKLAQSAAAIAYGYKNLDPELEVKGVIINNIASESHYQMIKYAIEERVGLKVLGYLPRQQELRLPERHLGLVPITESGDLRTYLDKLVMLIESYLDLEEIIKIANQISGLNLIDPPDKLKKKYQVKLGVAYDQAFNFYYRYNLDLFQEMGATIKTFSPLEDVKLPEVDGLYLGGGFPESYLEQLSANDSMKDSLREAIKSGLPTYAECGGLMYLCREIHDFSGNRFSMVGAVPACAMMTEKLQGFGYLKVQSLKDNALFFEGQEARGHEFHYSKLVDFDENFAYRLFGGKGQEGRTAGYCHQNILASYVHLHFGSNPHVVERFLTQCLKKRGARG